MCTFPVGGPALVKAMMKLLGVDCGPVRPKYEKMIISHHQSLLAWSRSTQSPHYLLITLDNFTQAAPITKTDETIFDISQFYLWSSLVSPAGSKVCPSVGLM